MINVPVVQTYVNNDIYRGLLNFSDENDVTIPEIVKSALREYLKIEEDEY